MNGNERREAILKMLAGSDKPLSGRAIAEVLHVSRQVIVQDMALLRAKENRIESTNSGYILRSADVAKRVFKVHHTDEQAAEELRLFVDYGATVEDVFVYHRAYGVVRADLKIRTEQDIERFLNDIATGRSSLLKKVTDDYHYHTVTAPTEKLLDLIMDELQKRGFLAALQDYEPVNFGE